jgi:putative glutamine amidotransferase
VITIKRMQPRVAIPIPHSGDSEYAARSLPQYEHAIRLAGGEPVCIPLDRSPSETAKLIACCDAVLLPGSKADVDPAKYNAAHHPKTSPPDPGRAAVDELLLQDAYKMRKPVLGICYGMQILNVHQAGRLLQHIESSVNHKAGREVAVVHQVNVDPESKLAGIVRGQQHKSVAPKGVMNVVIPVNSSHHQSVEEAGDGLRVVARCPDDGIIEAVEGTSPDHFVVAVQWHPERSVDDDAASRAIFRALVEAARAKHEQIAGECESV